MLANSTRLTPWVGNTLAHLLYKGPFREEPLRRRALELCESALHDAVLGQGVAAQLAVRGSIDGRDRGWDRLVELARASQAR